MEVIYYILILLLVIGVPILGFGFIMSVIKPQKFNENKEQQWSRKKIAGTGAGATLTLFAILMIGINTTMPQSIRNGIDANSATTKQLQDTQKQKADTKSQPEASKSEVKTEVELVPVEYAVIEKTDAALPSGQRKLSTAGVAGERTETYVVTYLNGKQVSKNLSKSEITKIPVDQVVSVGTYIAPAQNRTYSNSQPSQQQQAAPSNSGVYYANCTAARAAGAAPVYRGDPGYRAALDRDDDGIGCE